MVRTNKNGIKIYGEEDFAGMRKAGQVAVPNTEPLTITVQVMVAVPALTPFTVALRLLPLTVATDSLELVQTSS